MLVFSLSMKREKTPEKNIGFWSQSLGAKGILDNIIGNWATDHRLDGVVWTALPPKWRDKEGVIPTADEVVEFLRRQGTGSEAESYIRDVPKQIATEYRYRIETELGWIPIDR